MAKKDRKLAALLLERLSEHSPLIQVVLGPRQVGKTTAVKSVISKLGGVYESADSPIPMSHSSIAQWWKHAEESKEKILAIDEVQKIPGWSEAVKKLWDQSPLKLIVTGSSALLVEKGLKETLAGRFELVRAEHWSYEEASSIFGISLEQYLEYGCYPGSVRFLEDTPRWANYIRDSIVEPALGRDLLQLHPVDQPALLRQIFGVAVSLPAQVVSLQKMYGQLQHKGSIPTIGQYLSLLSEAFMVSGLQKYSSSAFRSRKSSPKLIVHDNALLRAFLRPIQQELSPELKGRFFENLVGARFVEAGWETYYWKDRSKEVDFVVLGPGGEKWAVEVKSAKATIADMGHTIHFCEKNPEFQPRLVSLLDQKVDGIETVPVAQVLSLSRI
jgi:predicted AAA+ superfamily ATPase